MNGNNDFRERLASSNRDAIRDDFQRIRFHSRYQRSAIPPYVQNVLNDCGRESPHNKYPLAIYPELAEELVTCGVPVVPVIEPMERLVGRIMAKAAPWLPSLDECFHTEQNANGNLDHVQITIASGPITKAYLRRVVEEGCAQMAATRQVVAVAQALYEKAER